MLPIKTIQVTPHFKMHFYFPQGILSTYISSIWASEGIPSFQYERIVPDGASVMLFNFGKKLISHDKLTTIEIEKVIFTGVFTHFTTIEYLSQTPEHQQVGVVFKPAGAYPLTQDNMADYKNIAVDFYSNPKIKTIYEQLGEISSPQLRIAFLNQSLIPIYQKNQVSNICADLITYISSNPNITTDEIIRHTVYSQQHLNRILGKYAGMNIKGFQKISRIQRAKQLINLENSNLNLTDIAYQTSYYDQAHFIHDFQEMIGFNPKTFKQLNNKQGGRVIYL
jgi:AraC-like DNA-binding protein